mgnify:FL=1|tara:strand:+ start:194 stop:832 length:639 start_codon:yes stop_codon:yes gene_type:complete
MEKKSVFETLSAINVNDKVEKKNNLTYLSWAWAWGVVKETYPSANYSVDDYEGKPYLFDEDLGYMVSTKVTIEGETIPMHLPVMDNTNKAMKNKAYEYTTRYGTKSVAQASMFDINTAIMRCLTKNLAMFGLGHYIYAGEDLPTQEKIEALKPKIYTLDVGDTNWKKVVQYVSDNKKLGITAIVKNLSIKYKVTPEIKTELRKVINHNKHVK